MKQTLVILGSLILVASVFGFSYTGEQQGLVNQAENALEGSQQDWELLRSLSMAGIALGAVILIAGLIPEEWYWDHNMRQ